jgi:hypothetical protein
MCDAKYHAWDISTPLIWLWPDLPYPRPDLLCECGKVMLDEKRAKKWAIPGSLFYKSESGLTPAPVGLCPRCRAPWVGAANVNNPNDVVCAACGHSR